MKITIFIFLLAASLQDGIAESLSRLHPAYIYNVGVTKVHEGGNITFMCAADNITKSTGIIDMYLFKNGERVKREAFEATTEYNTTFILTGITVEHSGWYTCLYSEENLRVSRTNAIGHNSVSLEVLGKILPGKIEITEKGETLKLTCTFTKIPNCTEVYVYLTFNGIGNSKKRVICSHTTIFTTFQLIFSEENFGKYSCVYSVSNYSLSEVRNTGENTIFVKESLGCLSPARIYNGGVTKVNEGENITLKCVADNLKENNIIYMYLFKNGERVMLQAIDATTEYDSVFILTQLTVEHSGWYTCLYSEEDLRVSKTNATGHKSVSLEVLGKILPAKTEITEKGETLKLTCTFTKIPNCTEVYVYLSFNGIGNSKKRVICSQRPFPQHFSLFFLKQSLGTTAVCIQCLTTVSVR
ncbi:uncharacterized protein LOC131352246 [Hemibagrus wyckioides]|uniref:uncharacterized protein LOC131352246 n=1 Tax=Hemibagrus wyckioides TaxID=337641 RepID=UPI00266C3DBC|nr:uncharacterized protein LOC131352246 [Hemibagrus wyckioides]